LTRRLTRLVLAGFTAAATLATLGGVPALAGGASLPAGVPHYYLTNGWNSQDPVVVRATATGDVTGTVRCPGAGSTVENYVPSGHQTFFVECLVAHGATRIFRFQLTAGGRPAGYQAVRNGLFREPVSYSLAAAADGTELALSVLPPGSGKQVVVLNTRTGARAVWRDGPGGPGMVYLGIQTLSLTATGRELVVFGLPKCLHGAPGNVCRANGEEARAVTPAARGGSLSHSRLILRQAALTSLRQGHINGAVVTANGRSLLANVVIGGLRSSISVVQLSAASGRRQRVLYRLSTGDDWRYTCVTVDPSSRWLLFDAGPDHHEDNGWIDHGRLIPLRPAGNLVAYEVWS
jgi:hypothetical protein